MTPYRGVGIYVTRFMNPTLEGLKKQFGRKFTVMLIPHSEIKPIRLNISVSFLVLMAIGWTGLTVWSGFIASRHVDYSKAKSDESALRAKVYYISQEMKKSREYMDRVRETEIALQNLLNMKSKRAIVEAKDGGAAGGPSPMDQAALLNTLAGRQVLTTIEEVGGQLTGVSQAQNELINNADEISKYVKDQRELFRATPMDWPTRGRVTSGFGRRRDPFGGEKGFVHQGLDIANSVGTPVVATADGVVQIASWQGGYGRLVVIDHGRGFKTYYAHNSELLVKRGDRVQRGHVISKMGTSGHSTGYHLHYEVWQNGRVTDPMKFVKGNPVE